MILHIIIDDICIRQFTRRIIATQSWYSIDICAIPVWVTQSWISAVIPTNEDLFAEILLHLRLNHPKATQDSKYI
ncbi:hypothetical protein ACN38_g6816 [Penicillium nordicum]|uniref:Uncharacterized protein n=1 Tax=Penicillium nordicum TaxID=229535 RepID=A0A0M8P6J0_9EURO|nr:hypothetical protein ACN38_g6816 [Penicillium nordicum]